MIGLLIFWSILGVFVLCFIIGTIDPELKKRREDKKWRDWAERAKRKRT